MTTIEAVIELMVVGVVLLLPFLFAIDCTLAYMLYQKRQSLIFDKLMIEYEMIEDGDISSSKLDKIDEIERQILEIENKILKYKGIGKYFIRPIFEMINRMI